MTQSSCVLGGLSWSEQEVELQRPLGLQGLEIKAVWLQVFMSIEKTLVSSGAAGSSVVT